MPKQTLQTLVRRLHKLVRPAEGGPTDGELLARFVKRKDSPAFAALVERHGLMVRSVCRRLLRQESDVDDAFQATFLVLLRKAYTIRKTQSLGSWLYGVAFRIAHRARAESGRSSGYESRPRKLVPGDPGMEAAWRELCTALDVEVHGLPEKYRAPIVLCYLEGQTRDQAARQLGWSLRTLERRLEQGRERLRARLARLGITLTAALLATGLSPQTGLAALPASLVEPVIGAVSSLAAGEAAALAGISPKAIVFAEAALQGTVPVQLKVMVGVFLVAAAIAGGAGALAQQMLAAKPQMLSAANDSKPAVGSEGRTNNEPAKTGRTDLYGDPLPEGAIARMGSIKWRHAGLSDFVFLDGGKSVLTVGTDRTLRFWDMGDERLVRSVTLQSGPGRPLALAPDGKTLAGHVDGKLIFSSTETGKEIKTLGIGKARVNHLHFSPDNKLLAVAAGNGRVSLWDWQKGKELEVPGTPKDSLDSTYHTAFSPDSRLLVSGVWWMEPLRIHDTATGREVHRLDCRAMNSTFSPDSKRLAVFDNGGAGGQSKVRFIELASGKETLCVPLGTDDYFEALTFSPDGRMLACGGYSQSCLVDCAKGEVRHRLPGVRRLTFSPKGKVLAGSTGSRLRFFDADTGNELHDRPSSFSGIGDAVDQIAISADGRRLASVDLRQNTIFVWDTANGQLVRRLAMPRENRSQVNGPAFAPDGRTLLVGRWKGAVESWDIVSGKERGTVSLRDPIGLDEGLGYYLLHASADGKQLCTIEQRVAREVYRCERLAIWEAATGKLVRDEPIPQERRLCSWSPDGLAFALATDDGMELRDVDSGRVCCHLAGKSKGGIVAASSDQRLFAVLGTEEMGRPWGIKKGAVGIWEAASGKEVARIAGTVAHLALTNGGRCLVTIDDAFLRLWDLATGQERRRWALPGGAVDLWGATIVSQLIALPDGRRVVTTLYDGTALVWDLSPALDSLEPLAKSPDEKTIAAWWADLAGDDAKRAYAAVWRLAEARDPAIAFLREHLRPVPEPDAKQIRRLINDLDSDRFTVREQAQKELEGLDSLAVPALREALEKRPSAEVRRRAERLLNGPLDAVLSSDSLQSLRALHALEQIGTPEARKQLRKLATGAPEARLTREAKASLNRLAKR